MRNLSEELAVVGTIDPASQSTGAVSTDVINLATYSRMMFLIETGVLGTGATVDFKLQGSADGSTGWTDITGAAITQIVKASGDNAQAILEVSATYIKDQDSTFAYVKGVLTIGTAASIVGVIALAGRLSYSPASDWNLASCAAPVTVLN